MFNMNTVFHETGVLAASLQRESLTSLGFHQKGEEKKSQDLLLHQFWKSECAIRHSPVLCPGQASGCRRTYIFMHVCLCKY